MEKIKICDANQVYLNNKIEKANIARINNNALKVDFKADGDSFELQRDKYALDNGKISTGDKIKGLISSITIAFSSSKNSSIETHQETKTTLSEEQIAKSLAEYKYGSDEEINQSLRLAKGTDETIQKIQILDEIFDSSEPLKNDKILYRGVHTKQNSKYAEKLKNLKAGDTFSEDAYLSTTSDYNTAQEFSYGKNGYLFKINLKKGSKVIDIESFRGIEAFDKNIPSNMNNESEFLLQRGSNFKVNSINKSGNKTIIECEYLGSTPKEITPITLDTPEEILNFKLEKLYSNPDNAVDRYIIKTIKECAKNPKQYSFDITKLLELYKDRISYTKNANAFTRLINDENSNILSYYDNNRNYQEMIDLLNYIKENSIAYDLDINGLIEGALQAGLELSPKCLDVLMDNGFLI